MKQSFIYHVHIGVHLCLIVSLHSLSQSPLMATRSHLHAWSHWGPTDLLLYTTVGTVKNLPLSCFHSKERLDTVLSRTLGCFPIASWDVWSYITCSWKAWCKKSRFFTSHGWFVVRISPMIIFTQEAWGAHICKGVGRPA